MIPLTNQRIKALYDEAVKLQKAGRLSDAAGRHRTILSARPHTAESHYQLGRIALSGRDTAAALDHLERARGIKPFEPAIWHEMARAHAAQGDKRRIAAFRDAARAAPLPPSEVAALDKVLGPDPALPPPRDLPADLDPVAAHMRDARPGEAARLAWGILAAGPTRPAPVLHAIASAQRAMGRPEAADAALAEASAHEPDSAALRLERARLLLETGRHVRLLDVIAPVLDAADAPAEAHWLRGRSQMALGKLREAESALSRALDLAPDSAETRANLAHCLKELARQDEAIAVADAGLARAPEAGQLHLIRAMALAALDRTDEAQAAFDAAAAHMPDRARALNERAIFLQSLGRFDAAEADFRAAIAADPAHGPSYRTFLATYRVTPDDPLIGRMEEALAGESGESRNRAELGFAMARAMEQTGQHDRIFTYLHPANQIIRRRAPYDIAARRREIDEIKRIFDGADLTRRVDGAADAAPIFVTGMPRSGTTLVEQILASHSAVDGAGEVGALRGEVRALTHGGGSIRTLGEIADAELAAMGRAVAAKHDSICPGAARVTDKSIQTYMVLGAVRLALPGARIVLVRRDPCDTALSIYKNLFAEGLHRYAYDLRDLGLYHAMFEEMVDFWRARLPGGFHEIGYEALLDDPEGETRRLLAACDLGWEDQCLTFHETTRRVSTLSVGQVRRPLYRSSVAGWRRHEAEMQPFIDALEEGRRQRHEP